MSYLTPEEKKRREEEEQRKAYRLARWNEENERYHQTHTPLMGYQVEPESYPDFPKRQENGNDEELKKRIEEFLRLEKQRFQEWLDKIGKKELGDNVTIENGRLLLLTPEVTAQYLVFNPEAKLSVSARKKTEFEVEKYLLDTLKECKNLGIQNRFKDSIVDIHITENGVTKVLSGEAKNKFLDRVVQKFEEGLHLESLTEEPRKRGGLFDVPRVPHGAPKPRPDK